MLQTLAQGFLVAAPAALTAGALYSYATRFHRLHGQAVLRGLGWAVPPAVAAAYLQEFLVGRDVLNALVSALGLLAAAIGALMIFFLLKLAHRAEPGRGRDIPVLLVAGGVLVPMMLELVLFPGTIPFAGTVLLSSDTILKSGGAVLGVLLAALLGVALSKVAAQLTRLASFCFTLVLLLLAALRFVVGVTSGMLVFGIIPVTDRILALVSPLLNNSGAFPYLVFAAGFGASLAASAAALAGRGGLYRAGRSGRGSLGDAGYPGALRSPKDPQDPKDPRDLGDAKDLGDLGEENPAKRRKLRAAALRQRRWRVAANVSGLLAGLLLGANLVWAGGPHLSPAHPVEADAGVVSIPIESVSDGRLHRFSYETSSGVTVRFLVVRKADDADAYGVGFDACTICGVAGYFERKKDVVCLNCDAVIDRPTIGLPGGCNPVPLEYSRERAALVIQSAALDAGEDVFR